VARIGPAARSDYGLAALGAVPYGEDDSIFSVASAFGWSTTPDRITTISF